MDGKEFDYFVLNTAESWKTGSSASLRLLPEGGLSLWPSKILEFLDGPEQVTGLAAAGRGLLYLFDANTCRLYTYSLPDGTLEVVPCIGGCGTARTKFQVCAGDERYCGGSLAVHSDVVYVADTYNHRVQAIDRRTYRVRFVLGAEAFGRPVRGAAPGHFDEPRDIVCDGRADVYVLDYGNRRIQKFSRRGEFRRFVGLDNGNPRNIAVDDDDYLYVLDPDEKKVSKYTPGGEPSGDAIDLTTAERAFAPAGVAVDREKNVYVGETGPSDDRRFFVWDEEGRVVGSFANSHGSCRQIVTDAAGSLLALCGKPASVVMLGGENGFLSHGIYYSKPFDSVRRDTAWHRLALKHAHLPERTKIDVYFHGSNEATTHQLIESNNAWSDSKVLSSPHNGLTGTDGLIRNARGRYLHVKIEMFGDTIHSPEIGALQVYFPRLSYLRYLPATYQSDPIGRDFLERFLSLFESFSSGVELQIAQLARHFDAEAAPDEFLEWLGAWLAVTEDDSWSTERKRMLLEQAYSLYKSRGTLVGLSATIELFTDTRPLIIEHFRLRRPVVLGVDAALGVSTVVGRGLDRPLVLEESSRIGRFALNEEEESPEKPFAADAFDFTILIDASQLKNPDQDEALRRLVEDEKPAHTRGFIRTGRGAEMLLGVHTLVGIDTRISRGHEPIKLGSGAIVGRATFVGAMPETTGTVDYGMRTGIDTVFN